MRFGLFCKSFRDDIDRFQLLYESVLEFDSDGLPFVVSVPGADHTLFKQRFGSQRVELVMDEQLVGSHHAQSWKFQQVVKLHAYKLNFADAWMVIDSDAYFINAFGQRDFVNSAGQVAFPVSRILHLYTPSESLLQDYIRGQDCLRPLTLEECRSFSVVPEQLGSISRWQRLADRFRKPSHEACLSRTRQVFPRTGPYLNFMPGAIWTQESLESLERDFLNPRGLDYRSLIQHAPWEAVWIGEWELARGLPNRYPAEPMLCHFNSDAAIEHARATGITVNDLAKRYRGIILAARHQTLLRF